MNKLPTNPANTKGSSSELLFNGFNITPWTEQPKTSCFGPSLLKNPSPTPPFEWAILSLNESIWVWAASFKTNSVLFVLRPTGLSGKMYQIPTPPRLSEPAATLPTSFVFGEVIQNVDGVESLGVRLPALVPMPRFPSKTFWIVATSFASLLG